VVLTAINSHVNCSKVVADICKEEGAIRLKTDKREREGEFFLILCGCPL